METSRNENILRSIINGQSYDEAAQSRIEELLIELKAVIEAKGGGGAYVPKGSVAFADLPSILDSTHLGYVYNVTNNFTTDARFVEGTGKKYSAGTNVVIVNLGDETNPDMKYDVMSNFVDIDSINSQIQAVSDMIANEFDITANYAIGDVVVYEDTLYKFITTHTAGAWNNQEVMQVTVYDIFTGVAKNITYSALKTLRDNNKLLAGQQYRITDYTCTTTQSDTQSAGNVFDIIVTADNTNTLNENAKAIQHEGDTYFADSNLSAWELKYSIDNDTNRYAWADSTNGKGVIYYLKDEYNNECGYDFKNIQMKFYKITATTRTSTDLIGTYSGSRYAGVENGSLVPANCTIDANDSEFRYTFDLFTSNAHKDYSLNKYSSNGKYCYDNKINVLYGNANDDNTYNKQYINIISFRNVQTNDGCLGNEFGDRNFNFSFGNNCNSNSFGNSCNSNNFGNGYGSNSFGDNCSSNSFGNSCSSNSFGNNCSSNSFGSGCYGNSFESSCYGNSFGNSCNINNFRNNCYSNSFGNSCYSNSFGNNCNSNSFGNGCYSNSFGDDCDSNSFGNYCNGNSFRNNCKTNSFGDSCNSNSFGNYCSNNTFADNTQYVMYGNNNVPIQAAT